MTAAWSEGRGNTRLFQPCKNVSDVTVIWGFLKHVFFFLKHLWLNPAHTLLSNTETNAAAPCEAEHLKHTANTHRGSSVTACTRSRSRAAFSPFHLFVVASQGTFTSSRRTQILQRETRCCINGLRCIRMAFLIGQDWVRKHLLCLGSEGVCTCLCVCLIPLIFQYVYRSCEQCLVEGCVMS